MERDSLARLRRSLASLNALYWTESDSRRFCCCCLRELSWSSDMVSRSIPWASDMVVVLLKNCNEMLCRIF